MIRIDEIYYNVFAQALQHRPDMSLHWFDPFGSVRFQDLCSTPNANTNLRLVFWDQEPVYQHTAREFFDRFCQVFRGQTRVITSEKHSQDLEWVCDRYGITHDYYFFHGWAALDWYRGYNHSYLAKPWIDRDFRYRFMCPNNIIGGGRRHRVRFFAELVNRGLIEDNLVSFPDVCPYDQVPAQHIAQDIGVSLGDCALPRVIDHVGNHANQSHCIDFWSPGTQAFAHVVTETVYDSTRLHLTEKTFKPIVMQQPFLLVAPRGSLAYLKQYGFCTFDQIWNESYDDADDQNRVQMIADILADIASWSPQQLRQAQQQVEQVVTHNYQWFYGGFQDLLWKELTSMVQRW